jgi:penicillin-binding protein 1C
VTFQNRWNVHDRVAFHEIPPLLKQAFILAEDKRFLSHGGVDWLARASALVQNVWAGRAVRGASTITEQVVRILNPRPRNLWSRWLEGFEARELERRFSKPEILEFYLNQVPYARNRRGIAQAARTYFDRDVGTLSPGEMLALAVLVRSPSRLDLHRGTERIRAPLLRLAATMQAAGHLTRADHQAILASPLAVVRPQPPVEAGHFVRFARSSALDSSWRHARAQVPATTAGRIRTTLDASLQERVQRILDRRVEELAPRNVGDGAVLVIDHTTDEILAWVNAFGFCDREGGQIDKVLTPRQAGSTLKPLVYALALEKGWTAATIVEDAPLAEAVGHGLHRYHNYSRHYYGPLRLREALGNSLNTPAVRAVRFTGTRPLLERLRLAGFDTLEEHPEFYGDGLALGAGEVTLYALVQAYATLARGGSLRPLRCRLDDAPRSSRRVFDAEVSSLIAHILSDPDARAREFGRRSLLDLPVQTAVKTGTSNDYRDAWVVGFSHRHTVGVWMGNVARQPMLGVSGAAGPALVLRSVFAELNRGVEPRGLHLSRRLVSRPVCRQSGLRPGPNCPIAEEWFREGRAPSKACPIHGSGDAAVEPRAPALTVRLESPTPGLHLALDPRIPDEIERFELRVGASPDPARVDWFLDHALLARTSGGATGYLWAPTRGRHTVSAWVFIHGGEAARTREVSITVK